MSLPQLQTTSRATAFSRLDFRAKAAVFLAVTLLALCWDDPRFTVALTGTLLLACLAVGISRMYLGLMFRVMLPFFLLLLLTHGFFNVQHVMRLTGQKTLTPLLTFPTGWWIVGGARFSLEGALYGLNVISKSMAFLLLIPLCVFTTDPNNLIVGLVRLRLPYKIVFVITSTLRFFPLLFDELRAVMETQRLRGYVPETMPLFERLRTYGSVGVPVILGAMYKAQQIEVVLQARAFSGKTERTYLHDATLKGSDVAVIVACVLIVGAGLTLRFATGLGRFVV